jgi:hypothetical protein
MPKKFLLIALSVLAASGLAQTKNPPTPTNLVAAIAPTMGPLPTVMLTWDAPEGPWGFALSRSTGDSLHFAPLVRVDNRIFLDRTVTPGNSYFYQVRSFTILPDSTVLESSPSNTAWITIIPPPPQPRGVITGSVRDDSTGSPLPGVIVQFYRMDPVPESFAVPFCIKDYLGMYKAMLEPGLYTVHADPSQVAPPGYLPEWFDNVYEQREATPVKVLEGESARADFSLGRGPIPFRPKGEIAGTVTDEQTGEPLPGAVVGFLSQSPTVIISAPPTAAADSLGHYSAILDTGVYFVRAEGPPVRPPAYWGEWYDNATEIAAATPVTVTAGSRSEADFALSPIPPPALATLEGSVSDSLGHPLSGATVVVMKPISVLNSVAFSPVSDAIQIEGLGICRGVVWQGTSNDAGHYDAQVPSGSSYIVLAVKWGYLPEYYKEKTNPLQADLVRVTGDVSGIDFTLLLNPALTNSISGLVHDSLGRGVPSRIVLFSVYPFTAMRGVRFGHTDSLGAYTIGSLHQGSYTVLAIPFRGYGPAFYVAGAFGVRRWEDADTVSVQGDLAGIDIGVIPIVRAGFSTVVGRVVGPDGTPLEGGRVFALSPAGELLGYGVTDQSGNYLIDGLPGGSPTFFWFDFEGYHAARLEVLPGVGTSTVDAGEVRLSSVATGVGDSDAVPRTYALHQNYPNPFNPATTITFDMPAPGVAKLVLYNILGQNIRTLYDRRVRAGRFAVVWDGRDQAGHPVASGIYLVRFTALRPEGADQFTEMRKMILLR